MNNQYRNHEFIEKAKSAKTYQELYSLAREAGMEMSEENAKMAFTNMVFFFATIRTIANNIGNNVVPVMSFQTVFILDGSSHHRTTAIVTVAL
ncbi:MAG: hypothetical protein ACI4A3_10165 [Lachnospiraceae bacterium]